ncbi:MAG TPA: GNAT family N-acetyltransferase [Nitrososphaeraceae archaeon]|nr:GNAT family N-acetyltransferase [Nitrososphaeraceae archaeon]
MTLNLHGRYGVIRKMHVAYHHHHHHHHIRFRSVRQSDVKDIIKFCRNTFSWGDYIPEVLERWLTDPNGRLFLAEYKKGNYSRDPDISTVTIGISHVVICHKEELAWIEGIRIHRRYRRIKAATGLIKKMLRYAKQQGTPEISAIVGSDNAASQNLLKKNGFKVISQWSYYICKKNNNQDIRKTSARVASSKDIDKIWHYLKNSRIYRLSGRRYADSWRWYRFGRDVLKKFVKEKRLIVAGSGIITGVVVLNKSGYWDKSNVLQIIYLDSLSTSSLEDLVSFTINLLYVHSRVHTHSFNYKCHYNGYSRFERLQVLAYKTDQLSLTMKNFNIKESEQFLLYLKKIKI